MGIRRLLPWLGWALAGVLALSAAGTALAANQASDAKAAAALVTDAGPGQEQRLERWSKLRRFRPLRRAVHGEVTVRDGRDDAGTARFVQVTFARGEIAEVTGDTLRVSSPDGAVTTFTLTGETKLRRRGSDVTREALQRGAAVFAVGRKDGGTVTAVRVVLLEKG